MIAQTVYAKTKIGGTGTITVSMLISVGTSPDDSGYQRFATEVAILDALEQAGKIRIDHRHPESSTGKRYVDMVRFTRLN